MQEAIRTTVWGSQGLTYRTLPHADMVYTDWELWLCKLCVHKYTPTNCLQTVPADGLWNAILCRKPHLHSHTLAYVRESARTFTLSSLAFPITGPQNSWCVWGHSPDSINLTGTLSCSQESLMSPLCYRLPAHISEIYHSKAYTVTGTFKHDLNF